MCIEFGREICGNLDVAETREWLVTNGIGGYASGTVAGVLTRRYHGLLMAALNPPLGRTLLLAKLDETALYGDSFYPLHTNRWADGIVSPEGYLQIESFYEEGTVPVWRFAIADALLEKRVWMQQGANTTYVQYTLLRATQPLKLSLKAMVNYRDYHGDTQGNGWQMNVESVAQGICVTAYPSAVPFYLLSDRALASPVHNWYYGFDLAVERYRGLSDREDHLHAATFNVTLNYGESLTFVTSTEPQPDLNGAAALKLRHAQEQKLIQLWQANRPSNAQHPAWVNQLILAADQFIVDRPLANEPDGKTIIAGYHWFSDWGRDTTIALPGLTLCTGRAEVARSIIRTFAKYVDRGMLPNRFPDDVKNSSLSSPTPLKSPLPGRTFDSEPPHPPKSPLPGGTQLSPLLSGEDGRGGEVWRGGGTQLSPLLSGEDGRGGGSEGGETPDYNSVDATLWYFEAIRAYYSATQDDDLLQSLFPVLAEIIDWYCRGTRYNIHLDADDGLLYAGEAGVQLTWMDAKVGDWVVTPRIGKPVEVNALWYNALQTMAEFARRLSQPDREYEALAQRTLASFSRFWNDRTGYCYDVLDGSDGDDASLRPNQIFAVSLPASPLTPIQQRGVVDICGRMLLTSHGLRSLSPENPQYQGHYGGDQLQRDGAYHQGTVWGWLIGSFVMAHLRVYSNPAVARSFLEPMANHLCDRGVGSLSEIFDGDAPMIPRGCIAQAWTVAEVLRAWLATFDR